ncbi:MAG: hypothetical protein Q8O07_05140 [Chloroflexota bacterium]|nr:hypothetical protein [Chloroflexota bacterium]
MRKRSLRLLALIAAVILAGLGTACGAPVPAPTAPPAPKPITLTIAHTNDVAGYLEPCG